MSWTDDPLTAYAAGPAPREPIGNVAELIARLREMPQDATPVDADDLAVTGVLLSADRATVTLWTEQK